MSAGFCQQLISSPLIHSSAATSLYTPQGMLGGHHKTDLKQDIIVMVWWEMYEVSASEVPVYMILQTFINLW